MRTNIEIDDELMAQAMKAGPYQTKKDTVEAGLKLLARQAAYREILQWRGKLRWEGDEAIDWTRQGADEPQAGVAAVAQEPRAQFQAPQTAAALAERAAETVRSPATGPKAKATRRAGR